MEWLSVGVKQAGMQRGGFCWWKRKLSVLFFSSFEMQIDSTSWYNLPPFAQPQSASTGKHRANNPQLLIVRHLCCFPRLGGGGWTFFPIRFPVLKIDTSFKTWFFFSFQTPPQKTFDQTSFIQFFPFKEVIRNKLKGLEEKNPRSKLPLGGSPTANWSKQETRPQKLWVFSEKTSADYSKLTWECEFPANREHDLAVTGSVGHQLQHLFVRFALDRHAVYTKQLVPRPQAPVLLGCTERHDGADVHLRKREDVKERNGSTRLILTRGEQWGMTGIMVDNQLESSRHLISCAK